MQTISVDELKSRMDAGEKINLIDCREPHEYAEFNIGAKLIPLGKIRNMEIEEIEGLKNEELIIHCRSGARSMQACMILEQMGFTNTKNVEGGVLAWIQAFGQNH
jgi:rhodanese-related sulfurtransferase